MKKPIHSSSFVAVMITLALAWMPFSYADAQSNCQANFTFTVNGNTVTFTNTSTGVQMPVYYWQFGDANYSSAANPVHTYANPGMYWVCLTLWDSLNPNCQSMFCDTVVISGNQNCNAMFYASPDSSNGCLIYFYDQSTGGPVSWSWSFGDNTPSSAQQNPVHQYLQSGNYIVCLIISTVNSQTCTYCDTVTVQCVSGIIPYNPAADPLTVFPNPAQGTATITYSLKENSTVEIALTDLLGNKILSETKYETTGIQQRNLCVEKIPAGVYLLHMQAGEKSFTKKLVIGE